MEPEDRKFSFYNDNPNENGRDGTEDEGKDSEGVEEGVLKDRNVIAVSHGLTNESESAKRREGKHAQAAQEREGQRRCKEGKKRNFLLVDEHTMKPYGMGVGDWRKELMLLSRNLDPAIGNINKQPEAALFEIVEWIQETWEYSSPIKFSFVREVIPCGVTLRRGELWKMILNNKP